MCVEKDKEMNNTKATTLLIMAAGIGSRFGGGIKQLEPVGLNDEIIMDYSIHDAIAAGFNKIIFVIRKDMGLIGNAAVMVPFGVIIHVIIMYPKEKIKQLVTRKSK